MDYQAILKFYDGLLSGKVGCLLFQEARVYGQLLTFYCCVPDGRKIGCWKKGVGETNEP